MKQTIDASAVLRYDRPADKWTEALPLGNGELGAMVYGRVDRERIALNLDTLWSGKPYHESYAPEEYEAYRAAQQLALKGEYTEAQRLLEKELLSFRNGQCYLPLGEMQIEYPARGRCVAYERRLDLKSAVHAVEMNWQSVAGEPTMTVRQECFVSAADRCMVLHVEMESPCWVRPKTTISLSA